MTTAAAVLTIDFLRHGETSGDNDKLYGVTDLPLSDHGRKQLERAAAYINEEPVTHIISSPKQRCRWLAEQHFAHLPTLFEQGFAEMDFGDWEGRHISELLKEVPDIRQQLSTLNPPGGESFRSFSRRVYRAWQDYTDKHIEHGGHHLLITHGGVIRVLLGQILHIPDDQLNRLYIPHAAWSRVTLVKGSNPVLWFINQHV